MDATLSPSLLIIDDDPLFHRMLQQKFLNKNMFREISYSLSGKEAIDMLKEQRANVSCLPDIIFLDLNMPDFDGWNFLQFLEFIYDSLSKEVKIYIVSASNDIYDRMRCRSYSFVKGYFNKDQAFEFVWHLPG